jgi:hypothetical protein
VTFWERRMDPVLLAGHIAGALAEGRGLDDRGCVGTADVGTEQLAGVVVGDDAEPVAID